MNAPETITPELDAQRVPHAWLAPSPTNPRKTFPAESLAQMAASMEQHDMLQPILVRPWPMTTYVWPGGATDSPFEIVAGERRWRAAQLAGLSTVPVLIRPLSDKEVVEFQMIENLHREDLHPLEEAEGYQLLIDRHGYTVEDLGAKIGKSKAYVYARLKLLALCPQARERFREGKLTPSTALLVARIPSEALQIKCLQPLLNGWNGPLSYRDAARYVQTHFMLRLAEASFDQFLPDLVATAGSCAECPKRSGSQPELFADVSNADICTDPDCFAAKKAAWNERQMAQAEASGKTVLTGKEAAKIVPEYLSNLNFVQGGYVALQTKCDEIGPRNFEEPEPQEPEEDPDAELTDEDEARLDKAYRDWEKTHETWEERRDAATPTYADLIRESGQTPPTVLVQHPRTGDMIECISTKDLEPILEAAGVENLPRSVVVSEAQEKHNRERKEKEQKAKAEGEYREALLDRILDSVVGKLEEADLRAVAAVLFERLYGDHQVAVAKLIMGEPTRENVESITRGIQSGTTNLPPLLLACALVSETRVGPYTDLDEKPEALLAAAKRWGVNPKTVRKETEEIARGKKQGKRGKIKPETVATEPATLALGDQVRVKQGAKGPNGINRKCCGREGVIHTIDGDTGTGVLEYSVQFGPKPTYTVQGLKAEDLERVGTNG